jgi:uncharacterized beta-barrel protein YwiB (DUF1934 family)
MKMFKEIKLCVKSEITPIDRNGLPAVSEETEKTQTDVPAFLEIDGSSLKISYLEQKDEAKIYTDIDINQGTVTVKRSGAIESEFVFSEGNSQLSVYKIPPYSFDAKIETQKIRNTISENGGVATIFYTMTLGGDLRAVKMRIEVLLP